MFSVLGFMLWVALGFMLGFVLWVVLWLCWGLCLDNPREYTDFPKNFQNVGVRGGFVAGGVLRVGAEEGLLPAVIPDFSG